MATAEKSKEVLDKVVIRFAGDSGDGMQLTGSQFTFTSALLGNDVATFPDFPAEIRAPIGTVEGVSGFQVQIGKVSVHTPGDESDVFVAMNPAALKSNLKWVKKGGTLVVDTDSFTKKDLEKAGYEENPLENDSLQGYTLVLAPITTLVKTAVEGLDLDMKSTLRCRNMFALGMMYWLFDRDVEQTVDFLEQKFKSKPIVVDANVKTLHAGFFYAETVEALTSTYVIPPADIESGSYRHISGNQATAWGLMAASEKLGRSLFCGSYPITPATDILQELSKFKQMDVLTLQAEDEIAAVCSTIGAAYAGKLGVTSSSGPGVALKGEAIGLAVMTELPIVIVDVQRAGPSTGMPTKTEQADLMQAIYGRNSDSPCIVVAGSTPSNCFDYAFEAARLAVEHMTPVIFLSDGYLGNGSEPWKYPKMADLPEIKAPETDQKGEDFLPFARDEEKLNRAWVVPGTKGFEHRIGGIEKEDLTGKISYDPENHEKMVRVRADKVARVANYIPEQEVVGEDSGEILVVGWGSTRGSLFTACKEMQDEGKSVSMAHFNYINPLPKNSGDVFSKFKKIIVFELNDGQFANYLRGVFPEYKFEKYTKIQGLPLTVVEIKEEISSQL